MRLRILKDGLPETAHASARLLFAAALLLATPQSVRADFDCLSSSRGGTLTWSNAWQGDQLDEGVPYRVASVVDHKDRTGRFVSLELVALGPARRSVRYLSVTTISIADAVCAQLSVASRKERPDQVTVVRENRVSRIPNSSFTRPGEYIDPRYAEEPDYPFIKYTARGWVLSDPPPYEAMTLCEVLGKRFRCLQQEKGEHSAALHDLEEELSVLPR